ncbi:MAG TPA: NAD(P)-dependent oxidoreductase [Acidimicrobiales bacterium]|nr:NAD(P)-dependent oxidoreductase [Acidimicrobiales bacterium]
MTDPLDLGVIGLGHIGGPVCANLVADGHRVTAYDVDPGRLAELTELGALAADGPSQVARAADITLLSLPSPAIMAAVAGDWLEGAAETDKILVDLTTNSPATVRAVGAQLAGAGTHLVEAPLTGGAPGAQARQLFFILGGDADQVAAVTPLLDTIGRGSCHLGPLGCGNVGKLVNSLMAFTTQWVALEGLALAARHDIDLRQLVEMIRTTRGSTSYFERRVEEIAERGRPTEFAMDLAAKDAGLMLEVGRDAGVPLPVASAIHEVLVLAKAQGLGSADISDLVEVMERTVNVTLELRPPEA